MLENTALQNEDAAIKLNQYKLIKCAIMSLGERATLENILRDMKHKYDYLIAKSISDEFVMESLNDYRIDANELKSKIIKTEEIARIKLVFMFYNRYEDFLETYNEAYKVCNV